MLSCTILYLLYWFAFPIHCCMWNWSRHVEWGRIQVPFVYVRTAQQHCCLLPYPSVFQQPLAGPPDLNLDLLVEVPDLSWYDEWRFHSFSPLWLVSMPAMTLSLALGVACDCFHATSAKLKSYGQHCMVCKAQNIYFLACISFLLLV